MAFVSSRNLLAPFVNKGYLSLLAGITVVYVFFRLAGSGVGEEKLIEAQPGATANQAARKLISETFSDQNNKKEELDVDDYLDTIKRNRRNQPNEPKRENGGAKSIKDIEDLMDNL